MGLFGDSQQEKELRPLMLKASETMQDLIDNAKASHAVTAYTEKLIKQLANEVNTLYQKSANLSPMKQASIQVKIDGEFVSLTNAKMGFVLFMKNYEREMGVKFI